MHSLDCNLQYFVIKVFFHSFSAEFYQYNIFQYFFCRKKFIISLILSMFKCLYLNLITLISNYFQLLVLKCFFLIFLLLIWFSIFLGNDRVARFSCIRCQDPIPNEDERFQCLGCSEHYSFDYCKKCNKCSKHKHPRKRVFPSCTP